jgi:hypothetical protein
MTARCTLRRSEMTPCVIEDGAVAYGFNSEFDLTPRCVGCGRSPETTHVRRLRPGRSSAVSILRRDREP